MENNALITDFSSLELLKGALVAEGVDDNSISICIDAGIKVREMMIYPIECGMTDNPYFIRWDFGCSIYQGMIHGLDPLVLFLKTISSLKNESRFKGIKKAI